MVKKSTQVTAATLALGAGLIALGTSSQIAHAETVLSESAAQATLAQVAQKDLSVGYTVSSWKASGYAGSVAIHAKNVGSQRYFGNFPMVSFKVEVKTASGPQGVDRLVTPHWYNGAYVRDLGFDADKSTHTYLVTLSNPIATGESALIASLNFGDGNTSEGRLTNYIEVTQVGRVAGDTSTANDQQVDSRQHTLTDFGRKNSGLF